MALRTWSGAVSGVVSVPGNWSALPGAGDTINIPAGIVGPAVYPTSGTIPAAFNGASTVAAGGKILGGTWPATAGTVTNNGEISGGAFNCSAVNNATISDGTFNGGLASGGAIDGGTFTGTVSSTGTITGGTFSGTVINDAAISGGTFSATVTNAAAGTINGGAFSAAVANSGSINAGTFTVGSVVTLVGAGGKILGGTVDGTVVVQTLFGTTIFNGYVLSSDVVPVRLYGRAADVRSLGPWPIGTASVGPHPVGTVSLGPYPASH